MSRACNHAANGRVTKKANDRNTNSRQSQKTKKSPKANRHISFSFQFWGQEKLPEYSGSEDTIQFLACRTMCFSHQIPFEVACLS